VEQLAPDYAALLERARKVQSEMLNRVTVDFGGAEYGLSSEELLSAQRASPGYSPGYLKSLFEMCRYWFIFTSGTYCSMSLRPTPISTCRWRRARRWSPEAWRPMSTGWKAWSRTSGPTPRTFSACAAPNIPHAEQRVGVETMFDQRGTAATGEIWPHAYWLGANAWCVRPFWDQYLVTGDLDFLRQHVVPAYKDLALFYEDFLTVTDKDGIIFSSPRSPRRTIRAT